MVPTTFPFLIKFESRLWANFCGEQLPFWTNLCHQSPPAKISWCISLKLLKHLRKLLLFSVEKQKVERNRSEKYPAQWVQWLTVLGVYTFLRKICIYIYLYDILYIYIWYSLYIYTYISYTISYIYYDINIHIIIYKYYYI